MDRVARLVSVALDVPVALVALVRGGQQAFPGMAGDCEPWRRRHTTRSARILCRNVIDQSSPLVLGDVRADTRADVETSLPAETAEDAPGDSAAAGAFRPTGPRPVA